MNYQVNVDNDSQTMLVVSKEKLDWLWGGIQISDGDARIPMTFLMRELGLLDDMLRPTWR